MSSVLTWRRTSTTKTGTTVSAFITDLVAAVNAVSGNADYKWQVASSDTAGNPNYVVLKRKDGSAGRILIVVWTSTPAGNNAAILDTTPSTSNGYVAWFPSGNVDTPSNLNAASGTIMGSDTNAVKVTCFGTISSFYTTNFTINVWDSEEACWFTSQWTGSTTGYMFAAGKIFVDASDNEQDGTFAAALTDLTSWGGTAPQPAYTNTTVPAGSTTQHCFRTNKGAANRVYFRSYAATGWNTEALATNPMLDSTNSRAYFEPIPLVCQTRGVGIDLKIRQLALGPPTNNSYVAYNSATLTPAARAAQSNSGGGTGHPWFLNFKI